MSKPNPRRRPTVRVSSSSVSASNMDGWELADWEKAYNKFAGEEGVPVEDVKIDISNFADEYATIHFFAYRDQTKEEELAAKQAVIDRANEDRERARKQIEALADKYPELMPYQVQELP